MIRMFFSFVLTVVVARWIYAEVELSYPNALPAIDYTLDTLRIPTHDRWDRERLERAGKFFTEALVSVRSAEAETGREILANTSETPPLTSTGRLKEMPSNKRGCCLERF